MAPSPQSFISWPSISERIQFVAQGVASIRTWSVVSALVGPLIITGVALLILGARTEPMTRDAERKRFKPLGAAIGLSCPLAALGGTLGTMHSYGYR
ncbi:hypothetical protein [Roseococcus suduntuyensis]|nr:hypothetical protein [Roseococcus suduntuyensis]